MSYYSAPVFDVRATGAYFAMTTLQTPDGKVIQISEEGPLSVNEETCSVRQTETETRLSADEYASLAEKHRELKGQANRGGKMLLFSILFSASQHNIGEILIRFTDPAVNMLYELHRISFSQLKNYLLDNDDETLDDDFYEVAKIIESEFEDIEPMIDTKDMSFLIMYNKPQQFPIEQYPIKERNIEEKKEEEFIGDKPTRGEPESCGCKEIETKTKPQKRRVNYQRGPE